MNTWVKRGLALLLLLALLFGLCGCSEEVTQQLTDAALDAAMDVLTAEERTQEPASEDPAASIAEPESLEPAETAETAERAEDTLEAAQVQAEPTPSPEEDYSQSPEEWESLDPLAEADAPASDDEPALAEAAPEETDEGSEALLPQDGTYTSRDDVALYIHQYGTLPQNFITKKQAQNLGWPGGSLEPYAPGKCIGGSHFGNYEGLLPEAEGRSYTECDIDTLGASGRGAKRIVFSNDGLIYYTGDHYETFTLLYTADGEVAP